MADAHFHLSACKSAARVENNAVGKGWGRAALIDPGGQFPSVSSRCLQQKLQWKGTGVMTQLCFSLCAISHCRHPSPSSATTPQANAAFPFPHTHTRACSQLILLAKLQSGVSLRRRSSTRSTGSRSISRDVTLNKIWCCTLWLSKLARWRNLIFLSTHLFKWGDKIFLPAKFLFIFARTLSFFKSVFGKIYTYEIISCTNSAIKCTMLACIGGLQNVRNMSSKHFILISDYGIFLVPFQINPIF